MEIINYPNYLIYDDGRVQNKKTKRFLKPSKTKKGYYNVVLCKNGDTKHFLNHRLVALHYIPKVEGKNLVDHIDRDKTNNHVSNLRWCNPTENIINSDVYITNKLGIKHIRKTPYNTFRCEIRRNGKQHSKSFKTLDEAIEYRDNYLSCKAMRP